MSDPFFLGGGTKRKAGKSESNNNKRRRTDTNSNIVQKEDKHDGSVFHSISGENDEKNDVSSEEDQYATETADEKRARLARLYLDKVQEVKRQKTEESEEENEEEDLVHNILHSDALKSKFGTYHKFRKVADKLHKLVLQPTDIKFRKIHQLSVTSVTISEDAEHIYSGSKDCCIIKWDISLNKLGMIKGSRKGQTEGHTHQVLSVSLSYDGEYLASGGRDKLIKIWNTKECKLIESFKGHRDYISGLTWRHASHDLYSCSADRTVKIWNCDSFAYIETLYGHQSPVTGIHCLKRDRCVTSSEDTTTRLWKIQEESQLVLRGPKMSIDCISQINDDTWITGSQCGTLDLWHFQKKKPICTVNDAHGKTKNNTNWISAVAALRFSDLVASGSCDGQIKLWKVTQGQLYHIKDISMMGWINSLVFSPSGDYLVVGIGQEHKMGRWSSIKQAKNGVAVINLKLSSN